MEQFVTNASHLAAQLERLAGRVGDPRPALERMRAMLSAGEEQVWGGEGAAIGFRWEPAVEPDRKSDPALLVATGALRASLTEGGGGAPATEVELRFGTEVPYARFHQYGTRKMHPRPFLGIPADVDAGLSRLLGEMIEEAE
jgi:phage gpG-like protein